MKLGIKHDRGVNNRQLPPCSCKRSQADRDDRYTSYKISYKIYGGGTVSRGRKIQVDIGGPMCWVRQ